MLPRGKQIKTLYWSRGRPYQRYLWQLGKDAPPLFRAHWDPWELGHIWIRVDEHGGSPRIPITPQAVWRICAPRAVVQRSALRTLVGCGERSVVHTFPGQSCWWARWFSAHTYNTTSGMAHLCAQGRGPTLGTANVGWMWGAECGAYLPWSVQPYEIKRWHVIQF